MEDGTKEPLSRDLYARIFGEEIAKLKSGLGDDAYENGRFPEAAEIFTQTATAKVLPDFLTLPAYSILEA